MPRHQKRRHQKRRHLRKRAARRHLSAILAVFGVFAVTTSVVADTATHLRRVAHGRTAGQLSSAVPPTGGPAPTTSTTAAPLTDH